MASVSDLIAAAKAQIGKPYVFGSQGPESFDCSGLTQFVYGTLGIRIPRTSQEQQRAATPVGTPEPGDLVFWGNPAYHVALYVGGGQVISAPQPGENVKLQPVWGSPTYGRVASLSGSSPVTAALATASGSAVNASFSVDKLFGQVEGVTLQLTVAAAGMALVGVGLWKATGRARNRAGSAVSEIT